MSTITVTWQNTVMIAHMCTCDCNHCSCVWCANTFLNELETKSFAYTKTHRYRNPHKNICCTQIHTHTHANLGPTLYRGSAVSKSHQLANTLCQLTTHREAIPACTSGLWARAHASGLLSVYPHHTVQASRCGS